MNYENNTVFTVHRQATNMDENDKKTDETKDIAMSTHGNKDRIPVATHKGILKISDLEIPCFVLDDGRRVLSGRAMTAAMALQGHGKGTERFLNAQSLRPFMSDKLVKALSEPIEFLISNSPRSPLGYEAFILPELCNAVLDAEEKNALQLQQKKMAVRAKILSRGFSVVGITALVDEATGYQEVRDRRALQKILERYISQELVAWAKVFPDEFYEELFRLRGWQWKGMSVKRPILVGKLTNDLVYQRLAPGVLEELKRLTPRDEKGRTKHRYHQHLTIDVGHPALEKHLYAIIALMRASATWVSFYRLAARSFPKLNTTIPLPLEFNDEQHELEEEING